MVSILVCVMLAILVSLTAKVDPEIEKILRRPHVLERYKRASNRGSDNSQDEISPLVRQAKLFAAYLNPPQAYKNEATVPTHSTAISPEIKTAVSNKFVLHTPKFALHGTCYYPSRPEKSLALVWQPGGGGGTLSWIGQGARLGHFVVDEIKRSSIIYRAGEQKHVMKVQRASARPSLVQAQRNDASIIEQFNTPVLRPIVVVRANRFLPEIGSKETTEEDVSGRYSPMLTSLKPP
jgi:hypothetical protein